MAELEGAQEGLAGIFEDTKQRTGALAQQALQAEHAVQVQQEAQQAQQQQQQQAQQRTGSSHDDPPASMLAGSRGTLGSPPSAGSPQQAASLDSPRSQQAPGSPRSQQAHHSPGSSPRYQLSPAQAAALHARLERLSLSRLTSMRLSFRRDHTPPMFCFELAVRSFAWSKYAYRHWVSGEGRGLLWSQPAAEDWGSRHLAGSIHQHATPAFEWLQGKPHARLRQLFFCCAARLGRRHEAGGDAGAVWGAQLCGAALPAGELSDLRHVAQPSHVSGW